MLELHYFISACVGWVVGYILSVFADKPSIYNFFTLLASIFVMIFYHYLTYQMMVNHQLIEFEYITPTIIEYLQRPN